jgi:hypothetical protein
MMKIAIAATTSTEEDAHVVMRGAWAPYWLFPDTESDCL